MIGKSVIKYIVMVIVVIQVTQQSNDVNVRKSRNLASLFAVDTAVEMRRSSKEVKEAFFSDLKEQMDHQAEAHSSVDKQLVDFSNICKQEKMETLSIWAEEYFAHTYIYSSTLIQTTTDKLKGEVGVHNQQIVDYVKTLDGYKEKTFVGYNDNYLVMRLFGIVRYAQSMLDQMFWNRLTFALDDKQEPFGKIIRGTEFSYQLIGQAGEQLIQESKMIKLYRKSEAYAKASKSGVKAIIQNDKPTLDVDINKKHVRTFNLLLAGDELCSTLVKLILIMTTEQHGGQGFKKIQELRKDEETQNYLTQYFRSFSKLIRKEVDDFGNPIAKSPVTEAAWDNCKLSERSKEVVSTMYDLLFFSQTGSYPPSDMYLRQYFSRYYYLQDDDMERLSQTPMFKAISFDRLIMWNHDSLTELDHFAIFQNNHPLFIHKFMADFLQPLVFKDFPYDSNPIINKLTNVLRIQAEIKQKIPENKRLSPGYILLERTLTMIYIGYSALRSGEFSDLDISGLKGSSEAVDVYKLLFKMFSTSKYVILLQEKLEEIDIHDLPEVYQLVLGYTCHKAFGGDDSKCAVDEGEIGKIFKTIRFRITYKFTPVTTITKFLVKILSKLLFEEFFIKFTEMAMKINFGAAYDTKTKQVDDNLAKKPYAEFYALLKYAYSANKDPNGYCWGWLVQYVNQEENVQNHFHTVFYYFIYMFATDLTANANKQRDFKEPKLVPWMVKTAENSLMKTMNKKIVSANVFFSQVFGMAGKQISFGLEDAEEYETFSGLIYYQMFLPALLTILSKKGGDNEIQALSQKFDKTVMVKLNAMISDSKVVDVIFDSVAKKGKTNLMDYFKTTPSMKNFKVRIQHIRRVQFFQSITGFFQRFNLGSKMFYSMRQSTFQNPAAVLANFFHMFHQFSQVYKGDFTDFYEFVFDRIKYCMEKSQFFGENGSDDTQCPWSYRKYAELYYFVKYDNIKSTHSDESLFEYHRANENIIHARIFMASMHNADEPKKELDELCSQESNNGSQFCFAWLAKNLIWDHVKTTTAKSISTEEFNQKLFELSQEFSGLSALQLKFGLLLAGECIDYFADQGSLTFDRYVNFFDYHKVILNPNSKNPVDKKMSKYYTSRIYSLSSEDKQEAALSLQQYSTYLKLTFAKRTYSEDEMMTQIAVDSLLSQPKEIIEQALKYGEYTNVYLYKVLLMFARGNDQFSKLAEILIDNEAFLETPLINNRKKDEIISKIIQYVSCSLWENETDNGKGVNNARIFKDIRNKNKGTVCRTKDREPASVERAPIFVVRLRRQLGSEIIESTLKGMETVVNSVQKDQPSLINVPNDDEDFLEFKEETEVLVEDQTQINDVKLNSYFEKSPVKVMQKQKTFNPRAKAQKGLMKHQVEFRVTVEIDGDMQESEMEAHKNALIQQQLANLNIRDAKVKKVVKESELKTLLGANYGKSQVSKTVQINQLRNQSISELTKNNSANQIKISRSMNFIDDINMSGKMTMTKTVKREVTSMYVSSSKKSTSFIFNRRRIRV